MLDKTKEQEWFFRSYILHPLNALLLTAENVLSYLARKISK